MSTYDKYFQDAYIQMMRKQAAQPPMDPSMMGGMPPAGGMPMDPSMMGGAPPMDPSMMGGMPPAGGMPMDPSMMGGMPPMDPAMMQAMMGAAPPPADPAAAAAPEDPAAAPKTSKQQKEELMNNIQSSLESIQDYVYNNLMILIQVAKTLNVQIPAEMLVAPPNGKNMDIMSDPEAIAAAGGQGGGLPGGGAPEDGSMPPGMADITMPPAEQAPSEAKVAMFRLAGIPSKQVEGHQVKKAMDYLVNREKHKAIKALHNLLGGNK